MIVEVILGIVCLILLWNVAGKPSHFPPGYWGLPLIGYVPFWTKDFERVLTGLHMKYGRIVSWRIGTRRNVFISDYQMAKEAFSRPELTERPDLIVVNMLYRGENLGLLGSNGEVWHNGRRFTLRHLRNFGMGKSRLDSAVQQQAEALVQEFKKTAGKSSPVPSSLPVAVINVIWSMVASEQYSFDDPQVLGFSELLRDIHLQANVLTLPDMFPWTEYVIPGVLYRKLTAQHLVEALRSKCISFFKKIIEDHEKDLNEDDPKDYIEAYLVEMKKQEGDVHSTMSKRDLMKSVQDLFIAGAETTSSMLTWSVFYLAAFPAVQTQLQQEVDEVLKGTLATLQDNTRLPYTEAFLHELHRHASFASIGLPHIASKDTYLGGYVIPKGTCVQPFNRGIHYDPTHWKNPDAFLPERFLSEDGKFALPKEGFMPFGTGKRQCLGESLARMELLIFLTTLVQNFSFAPPRGKQMDLSPIKSVPIAHFPDKEQHILVTVR